MSFKISALTGDKESKTFSNKPEFPFEVSNKKDWKYGNINLWW